MIGEFNEELPVSLTVLDPDCLSLYFKFEPDFVPVEKLLEQIVEVNVLKGVFWKLIQELLVQFGLES